MITSTMLETLVDDVAAIKKDLAYLVERGKRKEEIAGRRLPQYNNPHFTEVTDMVEAILTDANKPMKAPELYLEMVRRGMEIISVNPGKYLSTLLDREKRKPKAKVFFAHGANPGWRLKAPLRVPVDQVAGYTLPKQNGGFTAQDLIGRKG